MTRRRRPSIDEGRVYVEGPIADQAFDLHKSISTWDELIRQGRKEGREMPLILDAYRTAVCAFFDGLGIPIGKPHPLTLILTTGEHVNFHPKGKQRVTE